MTRRIEAFVVQLLRGLIRFYQLTFASLFPGACRFEPSCSNYARMAIAEHGPLHGSLLSLRRLCRCHPWGDCGHDPVPPSARSLSCTAAEPR